MPEKKPTRTADLDYFYGQSSELFSFYRIPKLLFQDSNFQPLSTDAKTLYGILLDRMSLSARNGWLDKAGRVFIIYTVQEVQDSLGCADKKATKLLRELEEYGLIERKRRGLGKPDLIYVKNFSSESSKTPYMNRDNDDSGAVQNTLQDPAKLRCNKTERNNTEISDTDPIYSDENDWMSKRAQLEEYFSQSLEVDTLLRLCPDDEDTIHNADTENKKAELFSKVRSGQVRVLLGSTAKMGAGTNVQTLLVAVHHLDIGWRPSDMTQRNGRIIRQGNQNKQVYVYNYVTESTFDAYLYQTLENKQKFISQIMTSKSPMRSCDDIDEQALSYAEIKALCAGDPRIREKMDLDVQVAKLKVLRGDFQNQKYRLEDKLLKTFPEEIQKQKTRIAALQQDSQIAAAHPQDKENFCGMTIKGMVYDDKKAAGERLLLARQEMPNADMMLLGTYRGFELNIRFDSFKNEHQAVLRAELSYPVSLGDDARGNITRLDNAIDNFADRIADAENALQNLEQQKQAAEVEVAKPFAQEEELAEKSARLAELNALLNIDRDRSSSQDVPEETEETETPATRPSVLAALGEKTNQPEPVKPFRSYYDKDGDAR